MYIKKTKIAAVIEMYEEMKKWRENNEIGRICRRKSYEAIAKIWWTSLEILKIVM
jgi:hypothetical protein